MPEGFDAHGVAVVVHVGLARGHARRHHLGVGQHGRKHGVAQRLLQVDVALRDDAGDLVAHEVVVHHLVDPVVARCVVGQRYVQVDVEDDALRRRALEIMHADAHMPREPAQEDAAAVAEHRVGWGGGVHAFRGAPVVRPRT
jgi:hypothetical protein